MEPDKQAFVKKALNGLKSDASLFRAFERGDASAFESLYGRYKDQMFNHLCHQLGTHANRLSAAEEIAQDVWMAVIQSAEKFEDRNHGEPSESLEKASSSFRAWLFAIAHRRLADFWRQHYKHFQNDNPEDSNAEPFSDSDQHEQSRFIEELKRGLQKLPTEQRQSFLLREEGFSYQEIADITGTSAETVKSRLRYAKQSLNAQLGGKHD